MAYNFGQKRIGAGNNQNRNNGMYTKTILGQLETFRFLYGLQINQENRSLHFRIQRQRSFSV